MESFAHRLKKHFRNVEERSDAMPFLVPVQTSDLALMDRINGSNLEDLVVSDRHRISLSSSGGEE